MNPTPKKTPQELMADCQGLVRSLAWQIHCKVATRIDLDDLVSCGQVGLAQAARDFDESRGGQFTTYAYYRIRGEILDGLSKMSWFKPADFYSGRYERMAADVIQSENGDHAAASGLDAPLSQEVSWLMNVSGTLATVHLFCQCDGDREDGAAAVEDHSSPSPPKAAMGRELSQKLRELVAALPQPASQLIQSAYFDGLSLTDSAARLGISKAWASRLHAKTLGQLSRSLMARELVD